MRQLQNVFVYCVCSSSGLPNQIDHLAMKGSVSRGQPLGCEPWMGEALGCCGPLFRHQVKHGEKEAAEGVGLLFGPLILFYQHVQQTPGLQLGDVTQIACKKHVQRNLITGVDLTRENMSQTHFMIFSLVACRSVSEKG